MNRTLWILQLLLALLFLFAGVQARDVGGADVGGMPLPVSVGFLRFIGVAEALGGLGLIFPGLLRIGRA